MALADFYHQFTAPVGDDTNSSVPAVHPQPPTATVHHHSMPQTWTLWNGQDEYQYQDGQQTHPNWRLYEDQQHERHHSFQHCGWQQDHEQLSLHHSPADLQSRLVDDTQRGSSIGANSPPVAPEVTPASKRSPKRSYNLRSSDRSRNGQELLVHNQYADERMSALVATTSEASSHLQRSARPHDEGNSSPIEDDFRQPSFRTSYTRDARNPDGLGHTPIHRSRVRTACSECRRRKKKCDDRVPCQPCLEHELTCDGHEATPAIAKEASENHAPTLREIRKMLQELLDRTSSGMQDSKRQKHGHDSEDSAMRSAIVKSRRLSLPQHEDEHRTGPHHLIQSWPSLAVLLQAVDIKPDCAYVMEAEDRPSLCLYPEDEKVDNWDDAQAGGMIGCMSANNKALGDTQPTRTERCGYELFGGRPGVQVVRRRQCGVERRNFIDQPRQDADTVEALYESYVRHMHILQPFLDLGEVRGLLDEFIVWQELPFQPSVAADHCDMTFYRPSKRQRHDNLSAVAPLRQPGQRRPLCHAVVYLILALGKICLHNDPLPAGSRETPGLEYYVRAVEIFGARCDSNELIHAHLFLLAGLYKGQLARVKESMNWYAMAGRVLRQLLRSYGLEDKGHWTRTGELPEERSHDLLTDEHRSSIVRAAHTCIQLESDILAELDLPSSGIISLETMLPMPGAFPGVTSSDGDFEQSTTILLHFTSQLYLRIRLNQIHGHLYGSDCEGLLLAETRCILQEHEALIRTWQTHLPADMSWNLGDAPPTNILHARLRAKYWGLRYLINRPFLDYILHIKPHPRLAAAGLISDFNRQPRREAEFHLFRAISEMSEEEVQVGYQTCIKAAENSTIAFDNILGRPIVTNIHGTAHA